MPPDTAGKDARRYKTPSALKVRRKKWQNYL
jgi:hypothetical protein